MWKAKLGRCAMKFEQILGGIVELRFAEQYTAFLLRLLPERGIMIYRAEQRQNFFYILIQLDDFPAVKNLLREQGCPFHVEHKYGLPFVISRMKRRKGLLLGSALAFSLVYLLLSFLWGYTVQGNVQYSDAHMIALVQEYGLVPGSRKDKFDYDELEQQIVREHPEFVWIRLEPDGTTLSITVKERLPDEQLEKTAGSIVAGRDGRVTELLVVRGTALVKRGDWVKKGQILVGGWEYPDRERNENGEFVPVGQPFTVRAQAVVSGEQECEVIGTCALTEHNFQTTGQEEKQLALVWNGHQFVFRGPRESPYMYGYQQTEQHSLLHWQNFSLPIYLRTTIFQEKQLVEKTYTKEDAYLLAVERARKRLQEQMPAGSRMIRESIGVYQPEIENVVQVKVVWLIDANLAQVRQAQLPVNEQENEEEFVQNEQDGNLSAGA